MEAVQLRGQKHLIARGSQPNVLCVYFVADEDADNFHEASGADVIKQLLCVWGWEKKKVLRSSVKVCAHVWFSYKAALVKIKV